MHGEISQSASEFNQWAESRELQCVVDRARGKTCRLMMSLVLPISRVDTQV